MVNRESLYTPNPLFDIYARRFYLFYGELYFRPPCPGVKQHHPLGNAYYDYYLLDRVERRFSYPFCPDLRVWERRVSTHRKARVYLAIILIFGAMIDCTGPGKT